MTEYLTGVKQTAALEISELLADSREGGQVIVNGAVHTIRDMGNVSFVILRKREGLLQCVYEEGKSGFDRKGLKEAACVEAEGIIRKEERAPHGVELRLTGLKVLSEPAAPLPLAISKWKLNTSLEAKLNMRSISLRNIRERAKFRIQEGIVRGFRDFLYSQGFTEIHTPKIGAKGAEGGSNLFRLDLLTIHLYCLCIHTERSCPELQTIHIRPVLNTKYSCLFSVFRIVYPIRDLSITSIHRHTRHIDRPIFRQTRHYRNLIITGFRCSGYHQNRSHGLILLNKISEITLTSIHTLFPTIRSTLRHNKRFRQSRGIAQFGQISNELIVVRTFI